MNIGTDFSLFVGAAGIGSNPNSLELQFDLDQLDHHDVVIEHNASLSRADASTGNDYSFNKTIWDMLLAYYDGMANSSIPVAVKAKAKYMRVQTESARDPIHLWTCAIYLPVRRDGYLFEHYGRPHYGYRADRVCA